MFLFSIYIFSFMFTSFSTFTARKVSKYGVISGPYFPAFGLNTERYGVISATSPNVRKYGPEITPYLDTFHAVLHSKIIFIHSKILVLHPIADLLCNNDVFIQYLVNFLLIHSIIRTFIIQFYFILSCILNIHSIIWLSKISTISLKTLTFI